MIMLREVEEDGIEEDRINAEAQKYAKAFVSNPIFVVIPRDLSTEALETVIKDISSLIRNYNFNFQIVIGQNSKPQICPSDDEELSTIESWYECIFYQARARLEMVLERFALKARLMHPFDWSLVDSKIGCVGGLDNCVVPVWLPLVADEGALRNVDPWGFSCKIADTLNGIKIVVVFPENYLIKIGGKQISSLRVNEIDSVVNSIRTIGKETLESYFHLDFLVSALQTVSRFTKGNLKHRRGHIVGVRKCSIMAELLTIVGTGTMVSDCVIDGEESFHEAA